MQTFETEHYIFHYGAGTAAERDIEKIAALQEMQAVEVPLLLQQRVLFLQRSHLALETLQLRVEEKRHRGRRRRPT